MVLTDADIQLVVIYTFLYTMHDADMHVKAAQLSISSMNGMHCLLHISYTLLKSHMMSAQC